MIHTTHRARTLGLVLIAAGVATTSIGVARGSGSGGPSAPEPAILTADDCWIFERRLRPEGSVLVIVPCQDEGSSRWPAG